MSDLAFSPVIYPVFRDPATARLEEDAASRGQAAGYAAGLRAAAAETAALRASLQADRDAVVSHANARADRAATVLVTAAAALDARQTALRTEAQETLLSAALQLAEAIIGYELRENSDSTVIAALTRALTVVDPAEVVAVRLNPVDLSALDSTASTDLGVVLVADETLARGDARADLKDGFIDASLGTALARARQALLGGAA